MQTIYDTYQATVEIKKSKFIALLFPSKQLNTQLQILKKTHPKARHFVQASRVYTSSLKQVYEHQSDDGEPKNSSGKPVLNVLRGNNLVNSAIVVVRYFGGTKLGVGGLVRAYTQAAQEVIKEAHVVPFVDKTLITLNVPYKVQGKVEYIIKLNKIEVGHTFFEPTFVRFELLVSQDEHTQIVHALKELPMVHLN